MTKQHPVTPTPELVDQWVSETPANERFYTYLATQAAQWGADQELEACATWVRERKFDGDGEVWSWATSLRAARRPSPPSPKEEALRVLENLIETRRIADPEHQALRQALEALPNG